MRASSLIALAVLSALSSTFARAGGPGSYVAENPLCIPRQETGAARIGNTVYVTGGLLAGFPLSATDTVEAYDISAGTWSLSPPMPVALDHMATAALGGKLYVIGGFSGDFVARDDVWIFDPQTNLWSPGPSLPVARGASWAVSHQERIYLFGGEGASGTANDTFIFEPASGWSAGASMPTPREHLVAVSLGDFIYVVGGRAGPATNVNERYDPVANTWTTLAPMPTARSAMAAAAFGGRVWMLGGEVPVLQSANESYDPVTNTWSTHAPMQLPRHGIAAVALEDRILLPAGGIIQGLLPTDQANAFVPDPCPGAVPYCFGAGDCPCSNPGSGTAGCGNSAGAGAVLTSSGSPSESADDLVLEISGLASGEPGIVYMGAGPARFPFGDGLRCVGAGGIGLFRFPVRTANLAGAFQEGPGLVAFSQAQFGPQGYLEAGATWNFQGWYRDAAGPCGSSFNLSNGLSVTVAP